MLPKVIWGSPHPWPKLAKFAYLGSQKYPFWPSKMQNFVTKNCLLQLSPKVIWSPMTKICKFWIYILGSQKYHNLGVKNAKICMFCSICPQITFGGLQWPKFAYLEGKKCPFRWWKMLKFAPQMFCPLKSFASMTKICIFGGSKMPILGSNDQNFDSSQMPPNSFVGSPMTNICIFGGQTICPMPLPIQQPISASLCF